MRYAAYLGLLFALWLTSFHYPPADLSEGPIKTLVIDAGHGGKDVGAVGASYYEKQVALKVALELRKIIEVNMPSVKVVMTRDDDHFIPLHKRGQIAQDGKGDFFISIHCDGSTDPSAYGSSSYVLGINQGQERYRSYIRENESVLFEEDYQIMYGGFDPKSPEGYIFFNVMKNVFRQESSNLAGKVQDQFENRIGRRNRGVKQGPFIVLWRSGMPSILCELGFISNPEEETFLASEIGQVYLASALYRAIRDYNHEFAKKN